VRSLTQRPQAAEAARTRAPASPTVVSTTFTRAKRLLSPSTSVQRPSSWSVHDDPIVAEPAAQVEPEREQPAARDLEPLLLLTRRQALREIELVTPSHGGGSHPTASRLTPSPPE
jgi:hypothetical protein